MKLKLALEEKQMDVRIRDRLAAEGKISPKDIKSYLEGLADEGSDSFERISDESSASEDQFTEQ